MRCSTGVVVWALLASSRLVLAQEAIPTFKIPAIAIREVEGDAHQSIEGDDPPVLTRTQADTASSPAEVPIRTPRPHTSGGTRTHTHPFTIHPTNHAPPVSFAPPHRGGGGATDRDPSPSPPAARHRISTVGLVFACLGGIACVLILLALVRFFYVWRRTPSRDRIAGLLQRHQLEREMEEREREEIARRVQQRTAPQWRPPPPPYQPAPAYDAIAESPPITQV